METKEISMSDVSPINKEVIMSDLPINDTNDKETKQQPVISFASLSLSDKDSIKKLYQNLQFDVCDVSDHFENTVFLARTDNVSDTVILFSEMKIKSTHNKKVLLPVAMKMFVDPVDPNVDNSLLVEVEIYKGPVQQMLLKKHTPNLIGFVAYGKCKNVFKDIENTMKKSSRKDFGKSIADFSKYNPNAQNLHIIVCEQAVNAKKMLDWVKDTHRPIQWKEVIFQILYTLEVFNRYKLRHNDLHFGNIFISKNDKPEDKDNYMEFVIPELGSFYISCLYLPQIYDWDRGSQINVINNTKLNSVYCQGFGQCNHLNAKFDTIKIFCALSNTFMGQNNEITQFIKQCVSEDLLNYIHLKNAFCMSTSEQGGDYAPPDKPTQGFNYWSLPTLFTMANPLFSDLRNKPKNAKIIETYTMPSFNNYSLF